MLNGGPTSHCSTNCFPPLMRSRIHFLSLICVSSTVTICSIVSRFCCEQNRPIRKEQRWRAPSRIQIMAHGTVTAGLRLRSDRQQPPSSFIWMDPVRRHSGGSSKKVQPDSTFAATRPRPAECCGDGRLLSNMRDVFLLFTLTKDTKIAAVTTR